MQDFTLYTWNEIVALIIAVVMGTGAYIGVIAKKKKEKITLWYIVSVFFINLFLTSVASEALKIWNLGIYRSVVLPLVALFGQYIMDYIDRRYLKIFDAGLHKAGLDLDEDNTDEEENIETENKEL